MQPDHRRRLVIPFIGDNESGFPSLSEYKPVLGTRKCCWITPVAFLGNTFFKIFEQISKKQQNTSLFSRVQLVEVSRESLVRIIEAFC